MPILKFVSLVCHKPDDMSEDDSGFDVGPEDEPFLIVGHKKVWSGRMGIGAVENLSDVDPISFENSITVELWDSDPGYVTGEDDKLGHISIQEALAGSGELSHQFKRRKAEYTLTYKVE